MPDSLPFAAGGEPAPPRPTATVLIVTADGALGGRLQALLARCAPGLTCLTACSGPAALERLRQGGLELMLIDLPTSGLSAEGPLGWQRNAESPVPFIALIGPGEERLGLELMRAGALDCLVKDARLPERLPPALERALQRLAQERHLAADLVAMNHLQELSARRLEAAGLCQLLEEVLEAAIALQGADFGNVQLYNRQTQRLEIVAQRGFGPGFLDYFRAVPPAVGACGLALQRRRRVIIEDTETDPAYGPCRAAAAAAGYRAVQSTPMLGRGGEPLGVLSTHFRQPHRPSGRALRLTDLYAGQAAGLIERTQAEEALRASEERLRFATQEAGFGFYELDLVSGQAYRSPEYKALFGLRPNDEFRLDADQVPFYVHPDDRALLRNVTRESRDPRGSGAKDVEYRVLLPDGTVRWLLVRGRTSFEGEGAARRPVRSRGIALDITGRKRLEQEILEISGREQRRIGHDLHDDLCQRLGGLQLLSAVLEHDLAAEGSGRAAQAGQLLAQAQEALERARRLARGLAPVGLEEGGLVAALEGLAASAAELFGIECPFRAEAPVTVADAGAATHLYRIAQEAITNAARHGRATRVSLGLRQAGDGFELTVRDNGRGFSPSAAAAGMGLRIMKYRAGVIGATLEVRSEVGQGAAVRCTFSKGLCGAKGPKRLRVQAKRAERKPTGASPAQ